ncbi:MAG: ArsA-related P-loop ATPase [Bdellovibrionota bacterium]
MLQKNLFSDVKILVCVGSGGVGKTTLAAALGVMAAQQGLKVLVLTIDPSKRLAQTLGIEGTQEITEVPGQKFKGQLWASVINHQKVFDDFVRKAASSANKTGVSVSAERILKNKLYRQLSTSLSGSQEFTALEMLCSCHESGRFDLIILDTPPAKHAMDFLKAPQKLAALFNEGIAQWFRTPQEGAGFFANLLHSGTRQVLKTLENLTGADFVRELADFFLNIEKWQNKLEQRILQVHEMLVHPQTQFCLVTSFDLAKLKEAESFAKEIRKNGYHLTSVLLNRVFPDWILPEAAETSEDPKKIEIYRLAQLLRFYYEHRLELYAQFERKLSGDVLVMKLPDYVEPVSDLDGLMLIGSQLEF